MRSDPDAGTHMISGLLKNKAILLAQYLSAALVPLVLTPHILKAIGLERFGHFAVLLALSVYASSIVQYAFPLLGPVALQRRSGGDSRVFNDIFSAKLLLLAGVAVPAIVYVFVDSGIRADWPANLLLLLVPPAAAALNCTWFLQARERFLLPALFGISGTIAAVLLGLTMVDGQGAMFWAAVAITLGMFVSGAGTLLCSLIVEPRLRLWAARTWTLAGALSSLKEGRALFLSQFVSLFYTGAGTIALARLHGLAEAGIYGAMERMMNAVLGGMLLIHIAAYPTLVRLYARDRASYFRLAGIVVGGYLAAAALLAIVVFVFRLQILHFLYGDRALPETLLTLATAWIAFGIFGPVLTGYLTVAGASARVIRVNLLVLLVSLGLGIPGALSFGSVGWLSAILVGQGVVILEVMRCWLHERRSAGPVSVSGAA